MNIPIHELDQDLNRYILQFESDFMELSKEHRTSRISLIDLIDRSKNKTIRTLCKELGAPAVLHYVLNYIG